MSKLINWNEASKLNLISYLNYEILHPMGLAIARDPDTGNSPGLLIASDLEFEYPEGHNNEVDPVKVRETLIRKLKE